MSKSRRPKRLLFINHTDYLRGGGERNLLGLLHESKRRNYATHVIAPGEGEFLQAARKAGTTTSVSKFFWWGRPATTSERDANLRTVKTIASLAVQKKFDCIITNTLVVPWPALAAAIADRPHVWIASERLVPNVYTDLGTHYDFVDAFSNLIIADSRNNADYIRRKVKAAEVKYFYSFIDVQKVRLAHTADRSKIISIGGIFHRKNQLELLKAAALLKHKGQFSMEILLIGHFEKDSEYYQKLKAFINEEHLRDTVSFAGHQEDPFGLVGPQDIVVQPSTGESLSHVITEAMKLGLICVASDIPPTKESFSLGGGTMYKSGKPEDLARVLLEIGQNPEVFLAKAMSAKKNALRNLSEEKCHGLFFDALEKVFAKPNPRRELRHLLYQLEAK